jgi:hypothetical protein
MEELKANDGKCKTGVFILLHDLARRSWARKDQYYDESFIPPEYVRSSKQGVLTAVIDFLDAQSESKTFWHRKNCKYIFKMLTHKNDGLGLLIKR